MRGAFAPDTPMPTRSRTKALRRHNETMRAKGNELAKAVHALAAAGSEAEADLWHRASTLAADFESVADPSGEQGEEKTDWRARAVAHAGALKEVLTAREVVAGTFGETWLREAAETIRLDIGQEPFCAGATALHKDGTLPVPATDPSKEEQSGVELIAAERERQVSEEGWTPEHDDQHDEGELALAAACYAATRHLPRKAGHITGETGVAPLLWPWEQQWWKPYAEDHDQDEVRRLTKAGALIAAEIDRLNRKSRPDCNPAPTQVEGDENLSPDLEALAAAAVEVEALEDTRLSDLASLLLNLWGDGWKVVRSRHEQPEGGDEEDWPTVQMRHHLLERIAAAIERRGLLDHDLGLSAGETATFLRSLALPAAVPSEPSVLEECERQFQAKCNELGEEIARRQRAEDGWGKEIALRGEANDRANAAETALEELAAEADRKAAESLGRRDAHDDRAERMRFEAVASAHSAHATACREKAAALKAIGLEDFRPYDHITRTLFEAALKATSTPEIRMLPLDELLERIQAELHSDLDDGTPALDGSLGRAISAVASHCFLEFVTPEQLALGICNWLKDFGPRGDEDGEGVKPADPSDGAGNSARPARKQGSATARRSATASATPDAGEQEAAESSRVGGPSDSIELGRLQPPYGGVEHCASVDCAKDLDEETGAYMYRDLESDKPLCIFCGDCARHVELNRPERFKLVAL